MAQISDTAIGEGEGSRIVLSRYLHIQGEKWLISESVYPEGLQTGSALRERAITISNQFAQGKLAEWWFDGVLITYGCFQIDYFPEASIRVVFTANKKSDAFQQQVEQPLSPWIRLDYCLQGKVNTSPTQGYPPCVPITQQSLLHGMPDEKRPIAIHEFIEVYFSKDYFRRIACTDCVVLQLMASKMFRETSLRGNTIRLTYRMRLLLKQLVRFSGHDPHEKRLFFESKVLELFMLQVEQFKAARCSCALDQNIKPYDVDKLHKARAFLETHIDTPVSLKQVSHFAGLNEFKLKKGFRILFGKSVLQYLTGLRMETARELLSDGQATVNEVAEKVGYQYAHHFIRAFRKEFGYTPGQLKK